MNAVTGVSNDDDSWGKNLSNVIFSLQDNTPSIGRLFSASITEFSPFIDSEPRFIHTYRVTNRTMQAPSLGNLSVDKISVLDEWSDSEI